MLLVIPQVLISSSMAATVAYKSYRQLCDHIHGRVCEIVSSIEGKPLKIFNRWYCIKTAVR